MTLTRQEAARRLMAILTRNDARGADLSAFENAVRRVRAHRHDRGTTDQQIVEEVLACFADDDPV